MEEEKLETSPLLKKKYHQNCPGCKVDQAKEQKKDVSFVNLSFIWLAVLSGSKNFNSLPNFSSGVVGFCFCDNFLLMLYIIPFLSFSIKMATKFVKTQFFCNK